MMLRNEEPDYDALERHLLRKSQYETRDHRP